MKPSLLLAGALGASLWMLACVETGYSVRASYPAGPVSADVGMFYDDLAPYGSWVTVAAYGDVWVPRVSPWWRPYSQGHWVLTDDGWTWVADEPWGWAPYHYGRWYVDPAWGWVWVPGHVWAPAWVAWRSGGGHVGWAALPPQVRWEGGAEFGAGSFDFDAYIAPEHWCFVDERYVTAPSLHEYIVPTARSVSYVRVTQNVTSYTVVGDHVVNRGLDVSHVERVTEHAVPRYQIVDRPGPGATTASDGRVSIYRPMRRGGPPAQTTSAPPPPAPRADTAESAHPRPQAQARPANPPPSPQELSARQEAERRDLERHQAEERTRVQRLQEDERRQQAERAKSEEVRRQHEADARNLERQQREQQQALARRQKEERKSSGQGSAKPRDQSKDKKDDKDKGKH